MHHKLEWNTNSQIDNLRSQLQFEKNRKERLEWYLQEILLEIEYLQQKELEQQQQAKRRRKEAKYYHSSSSVQHKRVKVEQQSPVCSSPCCTVNACSAQALDLWDPTQQRNPILKQQVAQPSYLCNHQPNEDTLNAATPLPNAPSSLEHSVSNATLSEKIVQADIFEEFYSLSFSWDWSLWIDETFQLTQPHSIDFDVS